MFVSRVGRLPQKALEMAVENEKNHQKQFINHRVEICRDRHDRQSCQICSSCVNFPRKIVANYSLLVCKIFGPKIRSCKFFDESQV